MPTLYDLTAELTALLEDMEAYAEDHDGDITDYPMERIEKLEGDLKEKALKVACMVKELKADSKAISEERKVLAAREKAKANKAERLVEYLESCLPDNAVFENTRAKISWANNPPAVEVLVPVELIPEPYLVRPAPEVSKEKLKVAMLPYQVPVLDGLGEPVLGPDEKPLTREELQVRWPLPTGKKRKVTKAGDDDGGEPIEVEEDVLEEIPIARMVRGRRISIK